MKMTPEDRFLATVERRPVCRPASWLGIPAAAAIPQLPQHFDVPDTDALRMTIGSEFGSRNGVMASRDLIREFDWPGTRQLVGQAKSYGLKVIHHSCGAIQGLIPDLIDVGVDVIHPIQPPATGMSAEEPHPEFLGKTSFCGRVDAQTLLVRGTPEAVGNRGRELVALFRPGLVISPSHEAILPDIPPANVEAFLNALNTPPS